MIYKLLVFIHFLGVLLVGSFFPGDVKVNVNAPGEVSAGKELVVKITLNKTNIESFARLQQDIPGGLEPEPITTSNAEFKFEDQKVKFIWLKLPSEEEFSISYKLKVNERLKGDFDLGGTFSYIESNERQSVDLTPLTININPSSSIDPQMIVDVDDFKPMVKTPDRRREMAQVRCIRQQPYEAEEEKAYIVNLLVNKGDKKKFAKIQETVPEGYTAVKQETKGAIFTFKDQVAKFLWMNLPSDDYFVVSYQLIPKGDVETRPQINGQFSYIEDENTRNIDIIQHEVNLNNTSKDHLAEVVRSTAGPGITADKDIEIESPEIQKEELTASAGQKGKVRIEIAEEAQRLLNEKAKLTHKLEPQSGVYYRVQIAAGHRPINVKRYFDKYNIDKEVRTELHEGWRKYSVGSFSIYKEARDYRVKLWNTTTIDDAFVAAYNDGDRITVQEALMITNHKWYR
jgi:hypothetical protein